MSDRHLRDTKRFNYAVHNRTGEKTPIPQATSFNQIREVSRDSDESSDDSHSSQSGSDSSIVTLVHQEGEVGSLLDLSRDLENLTVPSRDLTFLSEDLRLPVTEMSNVNADARKLLAAQESLHDDITDFIDENPTDQLLTIDDVNAFIDKLEDLRSRYRNAHKEIRDLITDEKYEEELKDDFNS